MSRLPVLTTIAAGGRGSRVVFLALAVGLWPATATSTQEVDKSMTVKEAISTIDAALRKAEQGDTPPCVKREPLQQISVTKDGFQYVETGKLDRGFWTHSRDDRFQNYSVPVSFSFKDMPFLQLAPQKAGGVMYVPNWPPPTLKHDNVARKCIGGMRVRTGDLRRFVAAVNRLIWENSAEAEESRHAAELAFEQKAAEWRALATKPALSDEVYKDRLLAEDALKNKDLSGAIRYYEAGVAADPTWAQVWYNAALLYAEQKDYFDAAYYMKHYVILVPDAPDSQTAKDNIILWQAKVETRRQ